MALARDKTEILFRRGILSGSLAAFSLVSAFVSLWAAERPAGNDSEMRQGGYQLINPLLDCEGATGRRELADFEGRLAELVNKRLIRGNIRHISVYFRDLNNGPWFGINEKDIFAPASLLKVPVMMAYLKKAEQDPALMTRPLWYDPAWGISGGKNIENITKALFGPGRFAVPGSTYTVSELLELMIVYSDNNARAVLAKNMDQAVRDKVYTDLGIKLPENRRDQDFLSVRKYSSFFRVLFNATYLNREMSERALWYLSRTQFRDGIVAGLPPPTVVAHKFGVRESKGSFQLHDCGIVYYPSRPYVVCVMTRGAELKGLAGAIAEVSKFIYNEVDSGTRP